MIMEPSAVHVSMSASPPPLQIRSIDVTPCGSGSLRAVDEGTNILPRSQDGQVPSISSLEIVSPIRRTSASSSSTEVVSPVSPDQPDQSTSIGTESQDTTQPSPQSDSGLAIYTQALENNNQTQALYFPNEGRRFSSRVSEDNIARDTQSKKSGSWKPPTLRLWFLLSFLIFQIATLAAVAILQHVSTQESGLTTITLKDSLSKTFLRSYLATAISLAVAICWGAINLDVLRTEPYVVLSRTGGAEINAVFDTNLANLFWALWGTTQSLVASFSGSKPPKYTVLAFLTNTAYIISFIILPPLQSSLMSAQLIQTKLKGDFLRMLPQNEKMEIANPADTLRRAGELWDDTMTAKTLPVPVFTAAPRRFTPKNFSMPGEDQISILPVIPNFYVPPGNSSWEASTTAYLPKLRCSLANISDTRFMNKQNASYLLKNTGVNFENLQYPISATFKGLGSKGGCQAEIAVPIASGSRPTGNQTDEWYYGGWKVPTQTRGSNDTSCEDYMFISINHMSLTYTTGTSSIIDYETTFNSEPTFSALICQPHYLVANGILAKFTANSTGLSASVDPHIFKRIAEPLQKTTFNTRLFESALYISYELPNNPVLALNSSGLPSIVQYKFTPRNLRLWSGEPATWSYWLEPQRLQEWSEAWLQSMFAANTELLAREWQSKRSETLNIGLSVIQQRLVVNPGYAIATQAVLGLLIVLTLLTIFFGRSRKLILSFDPAPIASTVALISHGRSVTDLFRTQRSGRCSTPANNYLELKSTLAGVAYIEAHSGTNFRRQVPVDTTPQNRRPRTFIWKRFYTQLGILAFAISLLCTVVALWAVAHYSSGLDQGSLYIKVDAVNSFAWTIIPVLAAVLLKFLWSIVDGYFRLMQPYITLLKGPPVGPRHRHVAIDTSYETTSMGWITIKAALRKDYMLSLIGTVSLFNELLVIGFGALFKSQLVPVSTRALFSSNSTMRTEPLKYPNMNEVTNLDRLRIGGATSTSSQIEYIDEASAQLLTERGGFGAPAWTTAEYSFAPLLPQKPSLGLDYGLNWTMVNTGVGAHANCTPLPIPSGFIEMVPVPESLNSSVVYSYEMRDRSQGDQETTNNTIVYGNSALQIPYQLVGPNAMKADTLGGKRFLGNKSFWAPLWPASISLDGVIAYPDIKAPGPVSMNENGIRNSTALPEIGGNLNHFAVGFAQYSRSQYGNSSSWYSSEPPSMSFLVCRPTFQKVHSKLTINPSNGAVLAHEPLRVDDVSLEATDLVARYQNNQTSTISANFGGAFLLRILFDIERNFGYNDLDFFSDGHTLLSSMFYPREELANSTNLIHATEKAFSVLFSQWAAASDNVWVNNTDGQAKILEGYAVSSQTRILISTTAMIIVVSILLILIGTLVMLPLWTRRWAKGLEGLERKPEVLGEVLKLVCQSENLLEMFRGKTFRSTKDISDFLKKSGKSFRIGRFVGDNEEVCFGIEVEDRTKWVEDGK